MTKDELIEAANKFFSDRTRSQAETRNDLQEVADEIEVMIESLDPNETDSKSR